MTLELPGYKHIQEPSLVFSNGQEHIHPLEGLLAYGPYSQQLGYPAEIVLSILCPAQKEANIVSLITELTGKATPTYLKDYYPSYTGFKAIYKIDIKLHPTCRFQFPDKLQAALRAKDTVLLRQLLKDTMAKIVRDRSSFSVLYIYLPRDWDSSEYNMHDELKVAAAAFKIPIQVIKEKALTEGNRANVLWGLSIATYAKAGGIPWKLKALSIGDAFLGISYSVKLTEAGEPEYATCCSQVFESDGMGFEFIAYDTKDYERVDASKNPYLSYTEMYSLMSKSLRIYQNEHQGQTPKKIYIHKSTYFTENEMLGCRDAFGTQTDVELLQIVRMTSWRGIRIDGQKNISYNPCHRGSYVILSPNECLLWIQGAVNLNQWAANFFKEKASIPKPIMIRRFSGNSDWHEICLGILGLSKMDWNNNQLYKALPVTLGYSQKFAQVVQHHPIPVDTPYSYIYFM